MLLEILVSRNEMRVPGRVSFLPPKCLVPPMTCVQLYIKSKRSSGSKKGAECPIVLVILSANSPFSPGDGRTKTLARFQSVAGGNHKAVIQGCSNRKATEVAS